jgi:FkbM family methyltransferase
MFTDPVKNLKQFGLAENMVVADLGAGTGFYTMALAQMVPQGKVYAIEIQKDFLKTLKNKIKDAHLNNVDCFVGDIEKIGGTLLKEGVVDAVVVSNVFFQLENQHNLVKEIKRILKMEGKVLVIDWSDASSIHSKLKKIISKEKMQEMFENEGFVFYKYINAGEHHYGMIFTKE